LTRKEFKDTVLDILLNEKIGNWRMFDADEMSRYKIAQYDEEDWDVEAAIPLDEFLDELYEVIYES
jgi:hypothetical protein